MDFDNRKVYGDTSITDGLVTVVFVFIFSEPKECNDSWVLGPAEALPLEASPSQEESSHLDPSSGGDLYLLSSLIFTESIRFQYQSYYWV